MGFFPPNRYGQDPNRCSWPHVNGSAITESADGDEGWLHVLLGKGKVSTLTSGYHADSCLNMCLTSGMLVLSEHWSALKLKHRWISHQPRSLHTFVLILVQQLGTNEPLLRHHLPEGTVEPSWDEQSEPLLINEMWGQLAQVLVDSIQGGKKVLILHNTQRDQ